MNRAARGSSHPDASGHAGVVPRDALAYGAAVPTARSSLLLALCSSVLAAAACGGGGETTSTTSSSTSTTSGTGGAGGSTGSTTSTGGSGGGACTRQPGPADGPRKVLVSHPFSAAGTKTDVWEVLDLDASGTLSRPGVTFHMGPAFMGRAVFTPDGLVAISAQDDGTLGVVRFDHGAPTVVHAAFKAPFYAGAVLMEPAGDAALVLDSEWRNIGGGVYRIPIGCDGTLGEAALIAPAKLPYALARLGQTPSRVLLGSADVLDSKAGDNAFLLDLGAAPSVVAGAAAFPDDQAIVSSVALTRDDTFGLFADNGLGVGDRVAVVAVTPTGLTPLQVLTPIKDPVAIVTSPFDNSAIVASGEGNAVYTLGFDAAAAAAPFTVTGHVTYVGAKPQLPGAAILLERGALRGRVLLAELSGVRQLRFEQAGGVTDLGLFDLGAGNESTVGVIGVQP
jgi:hypothetical protein